MILVSLTDESTRREAIASQFRRGAVQKFSCIERSDGDTVEIVSLFYAHRTNPSVFEQDVTIRNTGNDNVKIMFNQIGWSGDQPINTELKK